MASLSRTRRSQVTNYWPGFVDALSSLLLVIIFLLSLFMLTQFFLGQEIQGKDTAMTPAQLADRRVDRPAATRALQQRATCSGNLTALQATLGADDGRARQAADAGGRVRHRQ